MFTARLRGLALAIGVTLLLSGCGNSFQRVNLQVPTACENPRIIDALPADVRSESSYIPATWNPAPGTDLATVIENKGIACSYGLQRKEIGVTIYWTKDSDGKIFDSRSQGWIDLGLVKANIDGASKAYAVADNASLNPEVHSYAVDFLYQGVWIHIGSTYMYVLKDADPMIKAAISALETN